MIRAEPIRKQNGDWPPHCRVLCARGITVYVFLCAIVFRRAIFNLFIVFIAQVHALNINLRRLCALTLDNLRRSARPVPQLLRRDETCFPNFFCKNRKDF